MNINIKNYFINHLRIQEQDGWYLPVRLSEEQLQSYTRREPLYLRALGGAGLALGFRTAAKHVAFTYKITANVRDYAYCDVVVDGLLRDSVNLLDDQEARVTELGVAYEQCPASVGAEYRQCATEPEPEQNEIREKIRRVDIEIPGEGERLVELYLPHLAQIWLKDLTVDDVVQQVMSKDKFWLFLGDSITHGMATEHPAATYPVQSARLMDCDFINMGVCGATYWAQDLDNRHRKPDLITIALGTNDWKMSKSPEVFRQTVADYLKRIRELYPEVKTCGILPVWRSDIDSVYSDMSFTDLYQILLEEYAKYPEICVVKGLDIMPHLGNYYADGVHPNDAGFLHFTMKLCSLGFVKEALGK